MRACRAAVVSVITSVAASAGQISARLQHDTFFPFCKPWSRWPHVSLCLPRPSFYSVPARWTEAASPALRSSLTRCCALSEPTLWCIVPCSPSTTGQSCCRQSRAGGSWPRSLWTESKPRTDTTMSSTSARVLEDWRCCHSLNATLVALKIWRQEVCDKSKMQMSN